MSWAALLCKPLRYYVRSLEVMLRKHRCEDHLLSWDDLQFRCCDGGQMTPCDFPERKKTGQLAGIRFLIAAKLAEALATVGEVARHIRDQAWNVVKIDSVGMSKGEVEVRQQNRVQASELLRTERLHFQPLPRTVIGNEQLFEYERAGDHERLRYDTIGLPQWLEPFDEVVEDWVMSVIPMADAPADDVPDVLDHFSRPTGLALTGANPHALRYSAREAVKRGFASGALPSCTKPLRGIAARPRTP